MTVSIPVRRGAPRQPSLIVATAALSLLLAVSLPLAAAVTGTLTFGATTVDPGAGTTVDVTFTEDNPGGVLGGTIVSVIVTPQPGATGTVSLATVDVTCVPNTGTQVDCLWSTGSTSKSVALTATASADASGSFNIATRVEADDPDTPGNEIVIRPVQTGDLSITPPPTTTTIAPTTTTIPVTSTTVAATTVTTSSELPFTGGSSGIVAIVGLTLLALGGLVLVGRASDAT